jgi:hypothetical protein
VQFKKIIQSCSFFLYLTIKV